jgi:hypothetical protein
MPRQTQLGEVNATAWPQQGGRERWADSKFRASRRAIGRFLSLTLLSLFWRKSEALLLLILLVEGHARLVVLCVCQRRGRLCLLRCGSWGCRVAGHGSDLGAPRPPPSLRLAGAPRPPPSLAPCCDRAPPPSPFLAPYFYRALPALLDFGVVLFSVAWASGKP